MGKRIRIATTDDAQAIQGIYAPIVADSCISFEIEVPSVLEMARRIQEVQRQFPWLVFECQGEVLGYAYASSHRARRAYQWCTEVTVYVHSKAHKRGVGRSLYRCLFQLLRWQGYVNAYGVIALPNPSSICLHESMGFVRVAVYPGIGFKQGAWRDVSWWHLRLQEPPNPPPPPVPIGSLLREERVARTFADAAHATGIE